MQRRRTVINDQDCLFFSGYQPIQHNSGVRIQGTPRVRVYSQRLIQGLRADIRLEQRLNKPRLSHTRKAHQTNRPPFLLIDTLNSLAQNLSDKVNSLNQIEPTLRITSVEESRLLVRQKWWILSIRHPF